MTRTAGLRGLLPAKDSGLPLHSTLATSGAAAAPPSADETHGYTDWLMLGNGPDPTLTINDGKPVGDCAFAAAAHILMLKALVETNGKWALDPKLAAEIVPTANHWVGLYLGYQLGLTPGKTANSGPDNGTVLVDGLKWLSEAGIIAEYGPVGLTRPEMNAAVVAHGGVLVGVNLDEDADEEFEEHKPWKNHSTVVDPIVGGHAIVEAKYTPKLDTYLTWGADEDAEPAWTKSHATEAYWFRAPWEAEPKGYDLAPLRAALAA